MPEVLTTEDVLKIAKLARLKLTDSEIEPLKNDLNSILNYIEKLNTADTSKVSATSHVLDIVSVMREDKSVKGLESVDVFKNAPNSEFDHFKVPRIIDID